MGAAHPNWKHGKCTKQARLRSKATTAELRFLRLLAIELGMMENWSASGCQQAAWQEFQR